MRICIDLDGTICYTKGPHESYCDVEPLPGSIKYLQKLKDRGHYIIIYTARHMGSCHNNVGQVMARQGKVIIDWLDKYKIPYDEIVIGKPLADVYIDDKAIKFEGWDKIDEILS